MRDSDTRVLAAYLGMIEDGTAFDTWGEVPNSTLRRKIISEILGINSMSYNDARILNELKRTIGHIKTDDERALQEALKDFMIDEDEFKV